MFGDVIVYNGVDYIHAGSGAIYDNSGGWTFFTPIVLPTTGTAVFLKAVGNKLVLVTTHQIFSTVDGVNWVTGINFNTDFAVTIIDVEYLNGTFVATGNTTGGLHKIITSTDFITWTQAADITTNLKVVGLATNDSIVMAYTQKLNSTYFYYTSDFVTWTLHHISPIILIKDGLERGLRFIYSSFVANDRFYNYNFEFSVAAEAGDGFIDDSGFVDAVLVSDIITDLSDRSGIDLVSNFEIDTTKEVYGYIINRKSDGRRAIEPLSNASFVESAEGDKVKFFDRGTSNTVVIDGNDLIDKDGNLITSERSQELEIPKSVTVSYIDKDNNYEINSVYSSRIETDSKLTLDFNLPMVIDADYAKQISEKILYTSWVERTSRTIFLPIKYSYIEAGDSISVSVDSVNYGLRVTSIKQGANFELEVSCVDEQTEAYISNSVGANSDSTFTDVLKLLEVSTMFFIDTLPFFSSDDDYGYYVAMKGTSVAWGGGLVYNSSDGLTYDKQAEVPLNSGIGLLESAVTTHSGTTWDNDNTLVVKGFFTMQTDTEDAVLSGSNIIYINNEILQYVNASFVSTDANTGENTYSLTRLLRGRNGSTITAHAISDEIVTIDTSLIRRVSSSLNEVNNNMYFKPVSFGTTVGDAVAEQHTYAANNLKPLSPVDFTAIFDVSDNLDLSWIRRARINQEWTDLVDVPLDEPYEQYEIDVINHTTGLVVRTIIIDSSQSVVYSIVEQTTDFGAIAPVGTIIRVYQISSRVGRGRKAEVTL